MSNPHHSEGIPVKRGYFYYLGIGLPTPLFILLDLVILWAIYHAATTRTVDEYLLYGGIFGIPMSLLLGKLWFAEWQNSNKPRVWVKVFLLCNLVPGTVVFGALYYSLAASAYDFAKWLIQQWDQPYTGPFLVSAAVFLVGGGLFWFRVLCRAAYGLTEVLVGISVASYKYVEASAGSHSTVSLDPNLLIALLTAGVYLVVRGLDNVQQGLSSVPGDPIFKPLVAWYKAIGEVVVEVKELDPAEHNPRQQQSD